MFVIYLARKLSIKHLLAVVLSFIESNTTVLHKMAKTYNNEKLQIHLPNIYYIHHVYKNTASVSLPFSFLFLTVKSNKCAENIIAIHFSGIQNVAISVTLMCIS